MSAAPSSTTAAGNNVGSRGYTLEQITVSDASSLGQTITGTAIGNFTEWFDFGVYSYVIPILSTVFFPGFSHSGGQAEILAFAGLATSFVVRPIGGIFWGALGDRIGRKGVLSTTVILMAFGTFLLGVLPGYAAIGIVAPIMLFVSRAIQGFSTGGEYVGAMTFLAEHAPDKKRGQIASYLPVGTLTGYILGAVIVILLQLFLSHDAMYSWGWRVPFLIAGPLGVAGLYLRLHLEESPAYEKQSESDKMGEGGGMQQFRATVLEQWRPLLICIGLVLAFNVTNYMLTGYMPDFLTKHLHIAETPGLVIVVLVMVVCAIIVNPVGRLSDRVGRKPVMYTGSIMLVAVSIPMFMLVFQGGYLPVYFGTLPMGLMLVCFMSTEPSSLPTLFPTNVRQGATAVGFNLSVSAFGGTTPLIASVLVNKTANLMVPAYILIVAGIVGIVSVYFFPEPVGKPLKGSGPTVESEKEAHKIAIDWPPHGKGRHGKHRRSKHGHNSRA
jgi:MHS family proline/betaine transporter-like MFS transporter